MRIRRASVMAALLAALALAPVSGLAAGLKIISEPEGEQGVQRFVLRSPETGRDYAVNVSVPGKAGKDARLPVLYALDGGYGVVIPEGALMSQQGGMEPAVIVTIGYVRDAATARLDDLLHTATQLNGARVGGGGGAFETFLLEDLKPFVEARFPADPARSILFGHSVGGLFAAKVLAAHPDSFSAWVIASPSVWADPTVLEKLKAVTPPAGARPKVFIAVGGAEDPGMLAGAGQMAAALAPRFQVEARGYGGGTHLGYYPLLVATALPWLLPPK